VAVTLAQAARECDARGMRLCAPDELTWCCDSGCYHDQRHVWTSGECALAQLPAVAAPSANRWPI